MKKVYICSAYTSRGSRVTNMLMAKAYCRIALQNGFLPIAPHVMYGELLDDDSPEERRLALDAGLELLESCDEIWVHGPVTGGMMNEVERAEELDMIIRFICTNGSEWEWPKA